VDDAPARPPARGLQIAVLSGALAAVLTGAHLAAAWLATGSAQVVLHLLLSGAAAAGAAALAAQRVRRTEADLAQLAFSDVLTGLANRALFTDRLEVALRRTARSGGEVAVVFLDLDGFKSVNDSLGHAAGDRLIREVGRLLQSAVRSEDTLARLGGDEFAILVERSPGVEEATRIAERVLAALAGPVDLGGQRVTVSASIGIATGDVAATASSLLRDADNAMYWAKGTGPGRYVLFNPQMRSAAAERRELEADLWVAVAEEQFRLVYQPVVDLGSERITGFEALIRWDHPTLGVVLPERFLPVAEEIGLVPDIGRWVLTEACVAAAAWRRDHPAAADLSMAVNVSPSQLGSPALLEDVRTALATSGLSPSAWCSS